ncbi:MAG: AI-2E family transporter [Myxococcales bacterium]|nr:AI-2E family transporter [Myxococcales bacterium]
MAAAATVVLLGGLKVSGDVLLPVLFSTFLAIATQPVVRWLRGRGLPAAVAIPLVVVVAAAALLGLTAVVATSVRSFTVEIGRYEMQLDALVANVTDRAAVWGLEVTPDDFSELMTPADVMDLVGSTLTAVFRVLGRTLVVVIMLTFMLIEATDIEEKLRFAFGTGIGGDGAFGGVGERVQRYLLIKSVVSLITGVLAGLACRVIGIDFWLLWGLLAFLLNYIPTIGSIVAAVPPVLLAAVQLGWPQAVGCAVAYASINVMLGNFLEPRILGQSLGLSPLVVFLSLLFWGWMWGPAGMLLCVPMTVVVQLVLEGSDETRWIAVLLGSPRVIRRVTEAAQDPSTQ